MPQNFCPTAPTVHGTHRTPAALLAYRAANASKRAAVLAMHAPQAAQLRTAIRANLTQRAHAGDQQAVMYLLMQGW